MKELIKNDGLNKLLYNNAKNPFDPTLPAVNGNTLLMTKIMPYPFDLEAQVEDGSFIRFYYNNGDFDGSEVIMESQLNIDIVVAKSLWLINDNNKQSLIRPYEIMTRIVDMLGKRSLNSTIRLEFEGWQHLSVNTKFDAIRLYANYFSVET
jgi:hypothetical protein